MKTLVIHPHDYSTEFLSEIYKDIECTVIKEDISRNEMKSEIKNHDKIIMLGHGDNHGLFGHGDYIINNQHTWLLRQKPSSIYIWCHADEFTKKHGLKGFISGMIISEYEEAMLYCIPPDIKEINDSNSLFAKALNEAVQLPTHLMLSKVKEKYIGQGNPIIEFNQRNLQFYD